VTGNESPGTSDGIKESRFLRELKSWLVASAIAGPATLAFIVVASRLPDDLSVLAVFLISVVPLLAVAYASRTSLWTTLFWIGPFVIAETLVLIGVRARPFWFLPLPAFLWAALLMVSDRASKAVFGSLGGPFQFVTKWGMRARDRRMYGQFRDAVRFSATEESDLRQIEDLDRTAAAARAPALRVQALTPFDERWRDLFTATAAPMFRYAEMLEGKRPMDYDSITALGDRRDKIYLQLLRERSVTYRVFTWVPRPEPESSSSPPGA
jgi:hypothetical protein